MSTLRTSIILDLAGNLESRAARFSGSLDSLASRGRRSMSMLRGSVEAAGRGLDALGNRYAALITGAAGVGTARRVMTIQAADAQGGPIEDILAEFQKMSGIDPWETAEDGTRRMRAINEVMTEIVRKAGGDKVKLGLIFDAEAVRAFNQAAGEFQRTGKLESLRKFMAVQADGATTTRDSARAARDASQALNNLYTAWKQFADSSLTEPIQDVADALNALGSERTGRIIKGLAIGGAALGGLVLARKAWTTGRGIFDFFRGGRGAGAAGAAGGLGGMPLPLPVYVVNSKMSLLPGQMGGGANVGGAAGAGAALARRGSRLGRWLGRAGGALGLLAGGIGLAGTVMDDSLSTGQKVEAGTGFAGGAAGGWAGAKLGGIVGTAILPGVGTAIGAGLGGLGGYLAGQWGGETLAGLFTGSDEDALAEKIGRAVARNVAQDAADLRSAEGRLVLEIQGAQARVRSATGRGRELDVETGLLMGAY